MAHPTPLSWMGHTVQQNQILRYIDRENPFGEILGVRFIGPSGLIVTDCYCVQRAGGVPGPPGGLRRGGLRPGQLSL